MKLYYIMLLYIIIYYDLLLYIIFLNIMKILYGIIYYFKLL